MELSDYWSALLRGWWLIFIFALGGLVVGLSLPSLGPASHTSFQSTSAMGAAPPAQTAPNQSSLLAGPGNITPDQITYYAGSDDVMNATSSLSGLHEPIAALRDQISLIGPAQPGAAANTPQSGQAGVVAVTVTAPTAAQALAINNAFDTAMELQVARVAEQALSGAISATQATLARVYLEMYTGRFPFGVTEQALQIQVTSLQNQLAVLVLESPGTGFTVVRVPEATTITKVHKVSPFSRRPVRAAAGFGIGLILGLLAALGLYLLDKRLKTAKRAQAAFSYPVVAEIPSDSSDATEPYRMLWLTVFREPLPLPPAERNQRLYEGEDPVLEAGVGGRSGQAGTP
jgi:hypothetical protein